MTELQDIRAFLEGESDLVLGVVFGSTVRGSEAAPRDLDLAVELSAGAPLDRLQELEVAVARLAERPAHVVALGQAPPLLRFEIARAGVLLVERRPHAWVDFKVRAMLDWWDWAPYARRIHAAAMQRLRQEVAAGPS